MMTQTWRDRVGDGAFDEPSWSRVSGLDTHFGDMPPGRAQQRYANIQTGLNLKTWADADGHDTRQFGVMVGYGNSDTHLPALVDPVDGHADGVDAGVYWTWLPRGVARPGPYVDTWASAGRFQAWQRDDNGLDRYRVNALAASLETGYGFRVWQATWGGVRLEPQAQVIWHRMDSSAALAGRGEQTTATRLGVRTSVIGNAGSTGQQDAGYLQLGWLHNADDGSFGEGGQNLLFDGGAASLGYEHHFSQSVKVNVEYQYRQGEHDVRANAWNFNLGYTF